MKRLTRKSQRELAVKEFLLFKGFKKELQTELVDAYILITPEFNLKNFPELKENDAKLQYIIKNFPKFVEWLEDIMSTI